MNIVFVGHVDHGKSTIIGRLLADTGSLPDGKLEQVREQCKRNSKPFEYAFLLDALKDEQSQGITIDSARCFFKTAKREYIIIDAPGHIEFLKNMVTGAARAEAAFLVIDANEGIKENSKRHGYLLSMLGIKQVVVLVNKMDLVDYNKEVYDSIVSEYSIFLEKIDIKPVSFIPISGFEGDNITSLSKNKMSWYEDRTVLLTLDSLNSSANENENSNFRMPVQDVYKFTKNGDNRRIIAGTILSGQIKKGDNVIFYPSGKSSVVKTIENFNGKQIEVKKSGYACGFTLEEQLYIKRGEVACLQNEVLPLVSSKIKVNIFWLGKQALRYNKEYFLKLGTEKVKFKIEKIIKVVDASSLSMMEEKNSIERNDVAECILTLNRAIALELAVDNAALGRFVIIDDYEISGGGIVLKSFDDEKTDLRKNVFRRNTKWINSNIDIDNRAEKYSQKSNLIIITGEKGSGRKSLARELEKQLFNSGRIVYYLGFGNVIYGTSSDLEHKEKSFNEEHLRRLAEISNLMLDSGMILVVTAIELSQSDLEILKIIIDPDKIDIIWTGENISTDIDYDIQLNDGYNLDYNISKVKEYLQNKGVVFKI